MTGQVGTRFYRSKGLPRSITIHVSKTTHKKLVRLAVIEGRSLQVECRRILETGVRVHELAPDEPKKSAPARNRTPVNALQVRRSAA